MNESFEKFCVYQKSEKNIPFLDSLAVQLSRAPKTADQQYYILDDQLIACGDDHSIYEARRHQADMQEQLQEMVALSTKLLDLQTQKQQILEQVPKQVYPLGTLVDTRNHYVLEQRITAQETR